MAYRRPHYNCETGCKIHTAYIRVGTKWKRIGQFYTKCGRFKLDKPLQPEIVQKETEPITMSTRRIPESNKPQISDEELLHLCNSLSRYKGCKLSPVILTEPTKGKTNDAVYTFKDIVSFK
jgi:hypothetical protein